MKPLHLISFPDDDAVDYSPVTAEGLDVDLLGKSRHSYISKLSDCSSSWPAGSLDASCPFPVLTTQRHDDNMRNLHLALRLAIEDIIERWWTDDEARFPLRVPLEQEEEELLRVSYILSTARFGLLSGCYNSGWTQTDTCSHRGANDKDLGDQTFW